MLTLSEPLRVRRSCSLQIQGHNSSPRNKTLPTFLSRAAAREGKDFQRGWDQQSEDWGSADAEEGGEFRLGFLVSLQGPGGSQGDPCGLTPEDRQGCHPQILANSSASCSWGKKLPSLARIPEVPVLPKPSQDRTRQRQSRTTFPHCI